MVAGICLKVLGIIHLQCAISYTKYRRTSLIRTPFIRIAVYRISLTFRVNLLRNLKELTCLLGKFVNNSIKLTCLEITGYRIKYITVFWLLELQIRRSRKAQTQVHTVNSNSWNSKGQCSIFSKKNPIWIWYLEERASWYILTIKPTRWTNFSNLFLE